MDRQVRNIALLTLLLAALTIIAVVSPEPHRSTGNTVILYVAVVAAIGSVAFLLGSAVPLRVITRDISKWHATRREHLHWRTYHYRAVDQTITVPKDEAIRSLGMPCLVLVLQAPRRVWRRRERHPVDQSAQARIQRLQDYARALKDFEFRCAVQGRDIEVHVEPRAALARFPDDLFGKPGRYRVEWTITTPEGGIERARETLRLREYGMTTGSPIPRMTAWIRRALRHLRGLDPRYGEDYAAAGTGSRLAARSRVKASVNASTNAAATSAAQPIIP